MIFKLALLNIKTIGKKENFVLGVTTDQEREISEWGNFGSANWIALDNDSESW